MATINDMILQQLKDLNLKVDNIMRNGCAKAETHDTIQKNQSEIFTRINAIEHMQDEGRGKLILGCSIMSAIVGGGIAMFFQWIGKTF